MPSYPPGGFYSFVVDVFNQPGLGGVLVDPTSIQIDITYGSATGTDFAGPYTYAGGTVVRLSTGVYQYGWTIPPSAQAGVYVATWTIVSGPSNTVYYGFESIDVEGSGSASAVLADTGFWTGSLATSSVSIPFGSVDSNGIAWALLGIDGLDGVPTVGQVLQRGGDHGGYATPQFYGPRPLTLRVMATASSQALRDTARAIMQQAVPVSALATLVYNEPVPKTMRIRRSGVLKEVSATPIDVVFNVGAMAPDPRKYGTTVYVLTASANGQMLGITPPLTPPITLPAQPPAGSITAVNNGNFQTAPVVTVQGPITAPALYNQTSGMSISFSALTLSASDTLTVDLLNRVATLNGISRPADPWSAWWRLPPGSSQIVLQGSASAGARMAITYSDAWM